MTDVMNTEDFYAVAAGNALKYPEQTARDAFKLAYQSAFGCGHFVSGGDADTYLAHEYGRTEQTGGALIEKIGGGYSRINLAALDANDVPPGLVSRIFHASAERSGNAVMSEDRRADFFRYADAIKRLAREGIYAFGEADADEFLSSFDFSPISHSDVYRAAYKPAYRVVLSDYVPLIPLLSDAERLLNARGTAVMAIEGRAASGKTTASALIEELYGANVIHMDDFFLPPSLRTPERLTEAGGNVDYARFKAEVADKLRSGGAFSYRIYDCSVRELTEAVQVEPKPLTVVEGAYSTHPYFSEGLYDLTAFFDVAPDEQLRRIRERNGEAMAARFTEEWIPMEERYFDVYRVPQSCRHTVRL